MQYRARPVARNPTVSPQTPTTVQLDEQHLARAALTYLAEPGDPVLGVLLEACDPAEVLAAIKAGTLPGIGSEAATARSAGVR